MDLTLNLVYLIELLFNILHINAQLMIIIIIFKTTHVSTCKVLGMYM